MSGEKKELSFLEKMKQKAQGESYWGDVKEEKAKVSARTCPNCGAGRAEMDGLTHCAYCDFEFISGTLSDGIHIKKSNNSK